MNISRITWSVVVTALVTCPACVKPSDAEEPDAKKAIAGARKQGIYVERDSPTRPNVDTILKEAGEITRCQGKHQSYWCQRTLLDIANVQIRAGDLDGALHSIRSSDYGRREALVGLAEVMAKAGQMKRALAVLREIGTDHGWRQDLLDDGVNMACVEYKISTGDLDGARQTIDEMKAPRSRPEGLRKLAITHAKTGNKVAANRLFRLALQASGSVPDDWDRASSLWEIADAQIAAGESTAAASTIGQLRKDAESYNRGWTRVAALREAAVLTAKIGHRKTAGHLFRKAIANRKAIGPPCAEEKTIGALNLIAKAQVSVGYIDDALKTAHMIEHSETDFTHDGEREEVLCEIAVAQAKTGAIADALTTALSIEHCIQYQNDALAAIVGLQIGNGDREGALTTAKKIANPSRRAAAILKVATAHARDGDKKTAKLIAGQIQLSDPPILPGLEAVTFHYARAETWGRLYDQELGFTMASHRMSIGRAEELAAAAMTLAQALDEDPLVTYGVAFKDVRWQEVIRALARAHAACGGVKEAYTWARRIGSDGKVSSKDDHDIAWAVQQRIYALVGVAEGILDRRATAKALKKNST